MTHLRWCTISMALALAVAIPSHAQSQSSAVARADPLDVKASVPDVVHRSALTGYRPYADQQVGSWREANETVNRIGGWRVYAREARQPEVPVPNGAPAKPPTAAPASAPAGHGGHKMN